MPTFCMRLTFIPRVYTTSYGKTIANVHMKIIVVSLQMKIQQILLNDSHLNGQNVKKALKLAA